MIFFSGILNEIPTLYVSANKVLLFIYLFCIVRNDAISPPSFFFHTVHVYIFCMTKLWLLTCIELKLPREILILI